MAEKQWLRVSASKSNLTTRIIDAEIARILDRKGVKVRNDPMLRKFVGEQYIEALYPYIPEDTGNMIEHGYATNDGRLIWIGKSKTGFNYAKEQWENTQYNHTPPRTDHWTQNVVPGTRPWALFIESITPEVRRKYGSK